MMNSSNQTDASKDVCSTCGVSRGNHASAQWEYCQWAHFHYERGYIAGREAAEKTAREQRDKRPAFEVMRRLAQRHEIQKVYADYNSSKEE